MMVRISVMVLGYTIVVTDAVDRDQMMGDLSSSSNPRGQIIIRWIIFKAFISAILLQDVAVR